MPRIKYSSLLTACLSIGLLACQAIPADAKDRLMKNDKDGVFVFDSVHPHLHDEIPHALKEHAAIIDAVSPQKLAINDQGDIIAKGKPGFDYPAYIRKAHAMGVKVLPMVVQFSPAKFLADPDAMHKASQSLMAMTLEHGFDGLVLDIEQLTANDKLPLNVFVKMVNQWSRQHDKLLIVCVGARAWNDQFDYLTLANHSDALFVMFYDYTGSWTRGKPAGPTAPMAAWATNPHTIPNNLDAIIKQGVPPRKILLGIPKYGVDFTLDEQGMVASAAPTWVNELHDLAARHNAPLQWDDQKQSTWFEYTDDQSRRHQVWLESDRTYQAKLDLARSRGIAGIATWASRWADKPTSADFWPTVEQWLRASAAKP